MEKIKTFLTKRVLPVFLAFWISASSIPFGVFATEVHDHEHLEDGTCVIVEGETEGEDESLLTGDEQSQEGEPQGEPSEEPAGETEGEPSEEPAGETEGEPSEEPAGETEGEPSEEPAGETEGEPSEEPAGETEGEPQEEPSEEAEETPDDETSAPAASVDTVKQMIDDFMVKYNLTVGMSDEEIEQAAYNATSDPRPDFEAIMTMAETLTEEEIALLDSYSEKTQVSYSLYTMVLKMNGTETVEDGGSATPITGVSLVSTNESWLGGDVSTSQSGSTVTVKATTSTSFWATQASAKVVITNNTGRKVVLKYSCAASGVSPSGTGWNTAGMEKTLNNGESVQINFTSPKGKGKSGYITLSGFVLEEVPEFGTVTVNYDANLGTVTYDGATVSTGATTEVGLSKGILATPKSGYTFLGWIKDDNSIVSTAALYIPQNDTSVTITPVFVQNNGTPWFGVAGSLSSKKITPTHLYDSLENATASGNKYIVLMNDATLPAGTYTIPSGTTLLVPYNTGNTLYSAIDSTTKTYQPESENMGENNYAAHANPHVYRTLSMANGANLVVDGELVVGGKICENQHSHSAPMGGYGRINMAQGSTITVNNGGFLYSWGYIMGSGAVTAKSGATVLEPFQITDWRGGTAMIDGDMIDNPKKTFLFNQYYVQNIEVPLTLESGAKEYAYMAVYVTILNAQKATVAFIGGADDNALFKLTKGSVVKDYIENTGRLKITANGDFEIASISMKMSIKFGSGSQTIKSSNYVLPLTNNMTVDIQSGNIIFGQDVVAMPGMEMYIGKDATATITNGAQVYVTANDIWNVESSYMNAGGDTAKGGFSFKSGGNGRYNPLPYVPGGNGTEGRDKNAKIHVEGTIIVEDGNVYTTNVGKYADITGASTARINIKKSITAEKLHLVRQSNTSVEYVEIPTTFAYLKNNDGSYTYTGDIAGEYRFNEAAGKWELYSCASHKEVTTETKQPTCTEPGTKTTVCKNNCTSFVLVTSEVAALGHDYETEGGTVVTAPTCTAQGFTTYTCMREGCGETHTGDATEATGHDHEAVTTPPTCITAGVITYTCKNGCGDTYTEAGEPATGHSYNAVVTPPTCTAQGFTTYTCSNEGCTEATDGHSYIENYVKANGHSWGESTRAADPTCTEPGSDVSTCSVCGANEYTEVPATGHKWETPVVVAPTCTEKGYTIHNCANNAECKYEDAFTDALGHTFEREETEWFISKPATCTTDGLQRKDCTEEGCGFYVEETITALGHDKKVVTVDATCTTDGSVTTTCSRCDYNNVEVLEAFGHDYGEGAEAVVTAPTCTEDGFTTYKCKNGCGETKVADIVAATGHSWGNDADAEWNVITPATCEADGKATRTCENKCGVTEEKTLPQTGHNYKAVVTAPTCTEGGFTTYTCENDASHTYTSDETEAKGHLWSDWEEKTPAECEKAGVETRECDRDGCGATEEQEIPALVHDQDIVIEATAPTCTETGLTEGKSCSKCGATQIEQTVVPATGHDYDFNNDGKTDGADADLGWTQVTKPTCTEKGSEQRKCENGCGDTQTREIEALGHDYDAVVTAPTCEKEGFTTHTCQNVAKGLVSEAECGEYTYTDSEVKALGHKYTETITKPASCTEDGLKTLTCENAENGATCEEPNKTEVITATGHNSDTEIPAVEATCETAGSTAGTKCSVCGTVQNAPEVISAKGHKYELAEKVDAKCTVDGYELYVCANDEKHTYKTVLEQTGHNYESVVTVPTCDKQGFTTHTCTNCSDSYVNTYTAKLGHKYISEVTTNPECGVEGLRTYTCQNPEATCENHSYTEVIPALTHDMDDGVVTTEPTCYSTGVKTFTCTHGCGHTETETVAMVAHSYKAVVTKPTCEAEGYTTYTCTAEGCTEAAAGHSYVSDRTDAVGHKYDGGVITTHPICGKTGVMTYTCTNIANGLVEVCEEREIYNVIAALEHVYDEGVVTLEASCTEAGEKVFTCTNVNKNNGEKCTASYSEEIEATGHSYDEGVITTEPGCETEGVKTFTCTNVANGVACKHSYTETVEAVGHKWEEEFRREETCTTDGKIFLYCPVCRSESSETIPAQHKLVNKDEVPATCTEPGTFASKSCERCDYIEEGGGVIPATGHSWKDAENEGWTTVKEATCTSKGSETRTCTNEGCEIGTETRDTEMLDHDFDYENGVVTAPDCENGGYTTYTCKNCSATKTGNETEKLGHKYGDWTVSVAATCLADGEEKRECTNDGCEAFETKVIKSKGHQYNAVVTAPTCEKEGFTTYTCTVCEEGTDGHSYVDNKVPAKEHNYTSKVTKAATCTEDGERTFTCANAANGVACEKASYTETIEKYNHPEDKREVFAGYAATCTEVGYKDGEKCGLCGYVTVEREEIPALTHDFEVISVRKATCLVDGEETLQCKRQTADGECGYITTKEIKATGHNYTAVVTNPTCTADGYTTYTCPNENCERPVYTADTVAKLGHKYTSEITTYATCTATGVRTYTCQNVVNGLVSGDECGNETYTEVIPATQHSYTTVVTAPTCTAQGYTTYTCQNTDQNKGNAPCGHSYNADYVSATGHDMSGEWKVELEATCTINGLEYKVCSVCGENRQTQTIVAPGHSLPDEWTETKAPTCTEKGEEIKQCTECTYFEKQPVAAKGHSYDDGVVTAPTCTEDGFTTFTCTVCKEGTEGHVKVEVNTGSKTGHNYPADKNEGWTTISEATCTEDGSAERYCANECGHKQTKVLDRTGHHYDEKLHSEEVASPATCTTAAVHYQKCDDCEYINRNLTVSVGDKLGHNEVVDPYKAPTCTETGLSEGKHCDRCKVVIEAQKTLTATGHAYDKGEITTPATCEADGVRTFTCANENCPEKTRTETITALGHKYTGVVTAPTCAAGGYTTYTCQNGCGDSYIADELPVRSHAWDNGVITTPATCTEDGVKTFTCRYGDCNETKTETVAATGHSYINKRDSEIEASAATCTAAATHYVKCDKCEFVNEELTIIFGKANGHAYENLIASAEEKTPATCTEAAVHFVKCDNCDFVDKTKTVSYGKANGHAYENNIASEKVATPATCTEAAVHFVKCDNCDFVNEELTVVYGTANGHTFEKGFASEELVAEATCTTAAVYKAKCDECDFVSEDITAAYGNPNGHSHTTKPSAQFAAEATCTEGEKYYVVCDNCDVVSESVTVEVSEALGHIYEENLDSEQFAAEATCEEPEQHFVKCDRCDFVNEELTVDFGEALGHEWDEGIVTLEPTCSVEGETLFECLREECDGTKVEPIEKVPHDLEIFEAKLPTYNSVGWNEFEKCIDCDYTTYVEIPMMEKPVVSDYDTFMENLALLEELAAMYVKQNPGKDPLNLVIKYIRTGVDRYNSGSWGIMAGYEDKGFAEFVIDMEEAINSEVESTEEMIVVSSLKEIKNFTIPNGETVDFGHMFGTMDIAYNNNLGVNHADVGGWAGDLVDLLSTADRHNVSGTIEEMIAEISAKYLAIETGESDSFGETDMVGDLDGFYIVDQLGKEEYENGMLAKMFAGYFTKSLDLEQRADYFLKHRLNGVTSRTDIREAVFNAYTGNKVVATLEETREFNATDISDMRKACCYAFADYMCKLAGDYVEIKENDQFSKFDTSKSTLAPGITQEINKATMDDGKQVVYYLATADINSEYVNVYANYNENDPTKGWAMSRVLDQANAAQNKYGNPDSAQYIPNYNVIVGVNGAGYNMSTGEPSGLLVMGGVEYHAPNGDGFFGILKDGTAVIGTTQEYNTIYKGQVAEGIAAFGTVLVKDGKIPAGLEDSVRASRTAAGITKTGKVVFLVVDGRQEPVSCGGSMKEIAHMMLEAGCVHAVNLDGGGSTTFIARPEGAEELELISKPSDGFQRSVSTSLMMVSTAPSSTAFDHAVIESDVRFATVDSTIKLTAAGVSATGNAVDLPADCTWQVADENIGTITQDGIFTAKALGSVNVNLVSGGKVVGTKTINVVVPDTVYFSRTNIDAVYGEKVVLPVLALYEGKSVAINENDIRFTLDKANAGTFDGFTFTGTEGSGIKNAKVTAVLKADETVTGSVTVALYNQGEATFDFDKATGGDRQFAWDRQVSNSVTQDNVTYRVVDPENPMETSYIFAIDMREIPIPEILEELTYMLPGSDIEGASAWTFLMQLAERVSARTTVTPVVRFDPNMDVDISGLTVINDYFKLDSENGISFNEETNELTLRLNWVDQTQAIDPATANPMCILSGIKITPKEDAAWDARSRLNVEVTGEIGYRIYLRANALYTFCQDPENQETFKLYPFYHEDIIINGAPESGGYFEDTYKTFKDEYTLVNTLKDGWVYEDGGYAYYVGGEKLTGMQKIEGYYYDLGDNGINVGQTRFTGIFSIDGVNHYAKDGKLSGGWITVEENSYLFDENGVGYNGKNFVDEVELEFNNGLLIGGHTGFVKKSNGNTYHYVNGEQTFGWYQIGDDVYHFNVETGVMTTGKHVIPDPEAAAKGAYYDFAEDGRTLCGYFNGFGYYYWMGVPARTAWVKNGADPDPAAWYLTNANGHYATGSATAEYAFTFVLDGVEYKAVNIAQNGKVYTINIANGKLLDGHFAKENGNWYYYVADKAVTNGWFEASGITDKSSMWKEAHPNKTFIWKDGVKYVDKQSTFYAYEDGRLATGVVTINNVEYEFNKYGVLIRGERPDEAYSGTFGDNISWYIDSQNTLYINGSGAMNNDVVGDNMANIPWDSYRTIIEKVVIDKEVTTISNYAFAGCTKLTEIAFHEGITEIGKEAFKGCTALKSVTIPVSVTAIGADAFSGCTALESVIYAGTKDQWNSIVTDDNFGGLGDKEIEVVSDYETVENADGTLTITGANIAIEGKFTVPAEIDGKAVTAIGENAFSGNDKVTDVIIPEGITAIGANAFKDCAALKSVTVPVSVTAIGADAFGGCTALESVIYAGTKDQWNSIETDDGFGGLGDKEIEVVSDYETVENADGTLTITGANVAVEGKYTVPAEIDGKAVTAIGENAFSGNDKVTDVIIPEGITTIGANAFKDCTALVSITIPESVTAIGADAFGGCNALEYVYYTGTKDQWNSIETDDNFGGLAGIEVSNPKYYETVENADGTLTITGVNVQLAGVLKIPQEIDGKAVTAIGENAFNGCEELTEVIIPEGITSIGAGAFSGCTALTSVTIPDSVTEINAGAFDADAEIEFVVGKGSAAHEWLEENGFANIKITIALESIALPESIAVAIGQQKELAAEILPLDTTDELNFIWTVADETVAAYDAETGMLTAVGFGETTITVTETNSGYTATAAINVVLPKGVKLVLSTDTAMETIGMQEEETRNLVVTYTIDGVESVVPNNMVEFTSSNEKAATVDENGVLTAMWADAGTAKTTITAVLKNDTSKKATLAVKAIAKQINIIKVYADVPEEYKDIITVEILENTLVPVVIIPKELMASGNLPIDIKAVSIDEDGNETAVDVKWTTDASSVATVAATKAAKGQPAEEVWGLATVTVRKNSKANGIAVITATAKDIKKATGAIEIDVRDYTPRLESSTVTLNTYKTEGEGVALYTAYDAFLHDYNAEMAMLLAADTQIVDINLAGKGAENFTAVYDIESGKAIFSADDIVKNGTYKLTLNILTAAGETSQPFTVKVANKLPRVTIKQATPFELFYTDSESEVVITAKDPVNTKEDAPISAVTMEDTETFVATNYDAETDSIMLSYADQADPMSAFVNGKADTKAKLTVEFEGYRESYIYKSYTIKAKETKVALSQSRTSSKYTVFGADSSAINVINSKTKEVLDLTGYYVTLQSTSEEYVTINANGTELTIIPTLNEAGKFEVNGKETTSHTAKVNVQGENWLRAVTINHAISISTTVPTVKLKATSLKLNSAFDAVAETVMVPSMNNCPELDWTVTAQPTSKQTEADFAKLNVAVDGWKVAASIADADDAPVKGSYKYLLTAFVGEKEIKLTLTVNVAETMPSVTLGKTSVRLNKQISEDTVIPFKVPAGYEIVDAVITNAKGNVLTAEDISVEYAEGTIAVKVNNKDLKETSYKYEIKPIVKLEGEEYSKETQLNKAAVLTVSVYNKAPVITVSAKGKIDLANRGTGITYTVTKGTNFIYNAEEVDAETFALTGTDADKFSIEYKGTDAKGQHMVEVKANAEAQLKKSARYSYNIAVNVEGIEAPVTLAKAITVTPSQTSLKFTVKGSTTVYQSFEGTSNLFISVKTPVGAEIADVTVLDTKATTVPNNALDYTVSKNPDGSWKVSYTVERASKLKVNKTYKLALEITPEGNGENVKPQVLTVNLKVKR